MIMLGSFSVSQCADGVPTLQLCTIALHTVVYHVHILMNMLFFLLPLR